VVAAEREPSGRTTTQLMALMRARRIDLVDDPERRFLVRNGQVAAEKPSAGARRRAQASSAIASGTWAPTKHLPSQWVQARRRNITGQPITPASRKRSDGTWIFDSGLGACRRFLDGMESHRRLPRTGDREHRLNIRAGNP
jgi:hypothetical protein